MSSNYRNNNLYDFKEDFPVDNTSNEPKIDKKVETILKNDTNASKPYFTSENNNKLWLQEDWDDLEADEQFVNNLKQELGKHK